MELKREVFVSRRVLRVRSLCMVTKKNSKISGVLHRLIYTYPQHALVALYKSLFVPHLNYGSLLWGHNFDTVSKLKKKVVRTSTNSTYIAHSEPILKRLSLLKVQDMYMLMIFQGILMYIVPI